MREEAFPAGTARGLYETKGLGLGGGDSFTVFVSESENVSFPTVLTN